MNAVGAILFSIFTAILLALPALAQPFGIVDQESATTRPMLQWRLWANEPKPPIASFLFILVFGFVAWGFFPKWLERAQSFCRQRFWRSLGIGVVVLIVAVSLIRISVRVGIGWPLAIVLGGLLEAAMLGGLSTACCFVGRTLSFYLKLKSIPALQKRPDVLSVLELVLGALVCALLLQIPGIGRLPRLGTRIVGFIALVGVGGLFRTRKD